MKTDFRSKSQAEQLFADVHATLAEATSPAPVRSPAPSAAAVIAALRDELHLVHEELADVSMHLREAQEYFVTNEEIALASVADAEAAADFVIGRLRKIALKCGEVCS